MILLLEERNAFEQLTEDVYNLLAESAKQENMSYPVHLIKRVEAHWREIRLDYGEVPQVVMLAKTGVERAAFKVYLAWQALEGKSIKTSFDVAKALATCHVPDVHSEYLYHHPEYGFYRGGNGGDRTKVKEFRVGDHKYVTILEMSNHIHAVVDVVSLRYLRDLKLASFYGLIKREELTDYLEGLIYGDKPKENV